MEHKNLIEIKNLKKSYGKTEVLKGINLDIKENEATAILGANGAGKTTLVEIICQTKKATSGEVKFNFESGKIKENIGVQFQEGNWPSGITARDMLSFYQGIYPSVTDARVEELVDIFELKEFINKHLNKISGGQKQRFNALLAVLHDPKLVILDEVTTGLDIQLQYKILNYIKTIVSDRKHTLVLVSHGPEEVESLSDRVIVINHGKVFVDYRIEEIKNKYKTVRNMMDLFFEGKLESNMS